MWGVEWGGFYMGFRLLFIISSNSFLENSPNFKTVDEPVHIHLRHEYYL
jgi:hypothetical protein